MRQLNGSPKELAKDFGGGNIIPSGQRNTALARIAGSVRRIGCSEHEIRSLLRAVNSQRCDPPIDNTEVDRIARSIARYEPDQTAVSHHEDWAGQDDEHAPQVDTDPGTIPEELLTIPGLVGEVIAHNLKTAFKPQPELALAAALCLMSALTGRKVQDARGTRTNLFAFGIAGTGAGKEHARKLNKKILAEIGADDLIGPEGFASHAGVVSCIDEHPVRLFQIDEFGRLLKTLKNPAASPHLYGIVTVLLKLYTSANSQYIGDAYADTKKIKKIDQPHAVLYGTTVPDSFFEGLTFDSLNDGFLSRVLCFFSSDDLPEPVEPELCGLPETILEQAAEWWKYQPGGNLSMLNGQAAIVATTDDANAVFKQVEADCRQRQQEREDSCAALWSRVEEKTRTMALLYACSRDGINPNVDEDAATWAATLVEHMTRQLIYKSNGWITRGQHDANIKEILRAIRNSGPTGMDRTSLGRKFQHLKSKERDEILRHLIDTCQITEDLSDESRPGPKRIVYRDRRYKS